MSLALSQACLAAGSLLPAAALAAQRALPALCGGLRLAGSRGGSGGSGAPMQARGYVHPAPAPEESAPAPAPAAPQQQYDGAAIRAAVRLRHLRRPAVDPAADIPAVTGHVHSTESFSAVDGPNIRFIVFEQGCAMRCSFCSNPDTWSMHGGQLVSSKDLATQIRRVLPYLKSSHGGLTCSGGEPLLQPHFTAALFREAHAMGLTTTLDTTGQGTKHRCWDVVLPHTDGVLFCIKSLDAEKYTGMTGLKQAGALRFAAELVDRGIPFWVRYVLVPGHTDSPADLDALAAWARGLPTLSGIELLPYHEFGLQKWAALGLPYPLAGVETPGPAAVRAAVRRLEGAGLRVMCEGAAPAALSSAHTGGRS